MKTPSIDVLDQNLDGILNGEEKAWDACFVKMVECAENALRIKYPSLRDGEFRELADEAVYRFYKKSEKTKAKFPNGWKIRAFLKTTVRNLAIDLITKTSGKPRIRKNKSNQVDWDATGQPVGNESGGQHKDDIKEDDADFWKIEPEDLNPDAAEQYQAEDDRLIVHEALQQMGSPCKEIITMHLEDATVEQIRHRLGIGKSVAYEKIKECLEKMRRVCLKLFQIEFQQQGGAI